MERAAASGVGTGAPPPDPPTSSEEVGVDPGPPTAAISLTSGGRPGSHANAGGIRFLIETSRLRWKALWHDPALRTLRRVLLIGLVVRLVLAPLTSWGSDTPSFLAAATNVVYTGSPYSGLFFNPPLGPFVQAPFLATLALVVPPTSWVQFVAPIGEVVRVSGLVSTAVPLPAALLALKAPLILADIGIGLSLFMVVRPSLGTKSASATAALWLLNPLTIWVSSVHGEYDPLAAVALVALVWALQRRWAFGAGVSLGLAVMAKLVPIVLLPFVLIFLVLPAGPEERTLRSRLRSLALLGVGAVLASLPFLAVIGGLASSLRLQMSYPSYGGMSVLILYNAAVSGLTRSIAPALSALGRANLQSILEAVGIVAILTPAVAWVVRQRLRPGVPAPVEEVALYALFPLVGIVVSAPSPQSENLLVVLVVLLLAAPLLGRAARPAYVLLSAAGVGLYWALLTPLAYFYPLWVALGPSTLHWADQVEISYALSTGWISQGSTWLLTGLLGGGTMLFLWARATMKLIPVVRGPEGTSNGPMEVS